MAKNTSHIANLDDVNLSDEELEQTNGEFDQPVAFEDIKSTRTVAAGEYRLRNAKVKLLPSKTSGRPKFSIEIRVVAGEHENTPLFQDFSWAEGAQGRSKNLFVGMGLPAGFKAPTLHVLREALENLEYYGIMDIEQSDGINERTQLPYEPRNRLISTSPTPQTSGRS